MQKTRYLVTGGAGFIGSNIVNALTAAGERVRVLDNLDTGRWAHVDGVKKPDLVERITGDIRDASAVAKACEGVEIVFHEAALGSVPRSVETPIESDAVNTGGTVTVLDVARRSGVRRVVFAASCAVYGDARTLPIREETPTSPLTPYAVTKLADEYYLRVFAEMYGLETVNLRYFNIFGPNQMPDGAYAAAIPRFIDAVLAGRAIQIFGDGGQTRDFCYVDNAVRANLLAAHSSRKLKGEIINIAGGRSIEINALCEEIGRVFGKAIKVDHVEPRAGDIRHSLADISRARELLGYEPAFKWEDGIGPTFAYLRALREKGPSEASKCMTSGAIDPATWRSAT